MYVSCSRAPLVPALCRSILAAADNSLPDEIAMAVRELAQSPGSRDPVAAVTALEHIANQPGAGGAIIVIDELGKALEYMADNRSDGDVFVLQTLAEIAAGSVKPMIVCTVMHKSVDQYFGYLSAMQRDELAKVQGRFEEIAFHQPLDQMMRLMAESMETLGPQDARETIVSSFMSLAEEAVRLGVVPQGISYEEFVSVVVKLAPLHPLVAMVVPRVFTRLAQGERSLFAFMSSDEPHGLQDYLNKEWEPNQPLCPYSVADLYDYVVSAYGSSLYESRYGRNWAAADVSLTHIHDPASIEGQVIKAIAVISSMGPIQGKGASRELLRFALGNDEAVDEAIATLQRRSHIVYRSFSDSYGLWDGSDIDIEERLRKAVDAVTEEQAIDAILNELGSPRPAVAHRHSYVKGIMRVFSTSFCSAKRLIDDPNSKQGLEADARLVYVVCPDSAARAKLMDLVERHSELSDPTLVLVPVAISSRARESAMMMKRLRWVRDNTPALATDLVAAREWRMRYAEAQGVLANEIADTTAPSANTDVIYCGKQRKLNAGESVSGFLSEVCDRVFEKCPELRNELINRRRCRPGC